jgi:hypothetical protein
MPGERMDLLERIRIDRVSGDAGNGTKYERAGSAACGIIH